MTKHKGEGGPTLDAWEVAERLKVSRSWVLELAKSGKLPGWVKKTGSGWVPREGENTGRREVLFYEEDVEKYEKAHPEPDEPDLSDVVVDDTLRQQIIQIAVPELQENGYVTRTRVRDQLMNEFGYSDRVYLKIRKVALDEKWPLPKMQTKNTGKKRRKSQ